ncbi:nuclear transport factor 2 family protein [Marinicaulis aureus]|uniref:Nuclear transport factor 2 family protein n=1 Tax=Hyphococcus aureus TaxID=2666033 RepID=A0ABW1KTW7_9PROT
MSPETRFADYIDTFNNRDYERLVTFYSPDIRLMNGTGRELVGRDAIVNFYKKVNAVASRKIAICASLSDGETLAAELKSTFTATADAPDFPSGPLAKGDQLYINSFVFYDIAEGVYVRIRAAIFERRWMRLAEKTE